ncbi:MAG: hypothetical protein CVV41_21450 [Candidatus Riflebacteria bacterium HGW-Riflebacteria-1]|nr:MAG: hypothetical protein CVV41_21450 [Candidatus Riflebacteria bacterium HGW-Riflebacteria-1]
MQEVSAVRTTKILMLMLLLMLVGVHQAAALSIEAEVDRNEVGFGESLNLVVTLTQELGSGRTQTIGLPRIGSIPGFDIASTRSGQSTSFINGVGQARSQVLYELVPQEPGKFTIPAFSFSDGSGQNYSTKAIEVTVLPPPTQQEKPEEEQPAPSSPAAAGEGSAFFKALLVLGLLLAAIVAPVMILSAVTGQRKPAVDSTAAGQPGGHAAASQSPVKSREPAIEDAEVVANSAPSSPLPRQAVNFPAEVERLKRQHSEADKIFYQQYFQLFGRAALAGSHDLSESMTSDEMLAKAGEMCHSDTARQACRRLAGDIELTLYANRAPARAFSAIDADAREIINAILQ